MAFSSESSVNVGGLFSELLSRITKDVWLREDVNLDFPSPIFETFEELILFWLVSSTMQKTRPTRLLQLFLTELGHTVI